ncbi:MAG: S8 family peptidase [Candidatus Xenobia bacterium]
MEISSALPLQSRAVAPPPPPAPPPTDTVATGASVTAQRLRPYVVLARDPQQPFSADTLSRELSRFPNARFVVRDGIGMVNVVTASLDDAACTDLQSLGYQVLHDDPERYLLPTPTDRIQAASDFTDNMPPHDRGVPRPPLAAPRYVSNLTQTYTGRGVGIAFLDTGVYPHPDFTYPSDRIVAFHDFVNDRSIPYDDNGHGTHVAGDAAGNGFQSQGLYRGPASGANIVSVKVLNRNGQGKMSDILKGINWVIDHKDEYNIRVLNMSLGNRARADFESDPIERAVERAVDAGICVVAAAGNEGPTEGTICAPGDNPKVVTVGAVDDFNTPSLADDVIDEFSSRGPTAGGVSKPDLLAPGEGIVGPNAPGTPTEEQAEKYGLISQTLDWLMGMRDSDLTHVPVETLKLIGLSDDSIELVKTSPQLARQEIARIARATDRLPLIDNTSYVGAPGTSMATPIVSGVIAEMLEANPSLTPDQVKDILKQTAAPLPNLDQNSQGAGEINPTAAIAKALQMKGEHGWQGAVDDSMNQARAEASSAPDSKQQQPADPNSPKKPTDDGYKAQAPEPKAGDAHPTLEDAP